MRNAAIRVYSKSIPSIDYNDAVRRVVPLELL